MVLRYALNAHRDLVEEVSQMMMIDSGEVIPPEPQAAATQLRHVTLLKAPSSFLHRT